MLRVPWLADGCGLHNFSFFFFFFFLLGGATQDGAVQGANELLVKDCESKYGSKVNNIILVANEDTPLQAGDRLFLGSSTEMRQVYA